MTEHDEGAMKELAEALEAERERSAKLAEALENYCDVSCLTEAQRVLAECGMVEEADGG